MSQKFILKQLTDDDLLALLSSAREISHQIGLEVYLNGRPSLTFLPAAMSPDKANWLRRKRNAALFFGMSTLALYEKFKGDESLLVSKYGLDYKDYTATPGSVLFAVSSSGHSGALTVTGLAPEDDHAAALELLEQFQ